MIFDGFGTIDCTAPCSMYSVLTDNNLIDDPFVGMNEKEACALSEKDCVFESSFAADDKMLSMDYAELTFYGLDTICAIYFNGKLIGKTMNMHTAFTYDVKNLLLAGENKLRLEFSSPVRYIRYMNHRRNLRTNRDSIPGASHLRKALCMFGWDWGPALPDMGIYRDVELNCYNTDKINDFEVLQYHKDNEVELEIKVNTKHASDCDIYAEIDGKNVKLIGGKCCIKIDNPKLWWIRGYGEQHLYDLRITLQENEVVVDELNKKIGLRTIEVSRNTDKYGKEFTFRINGVEVFIMGANYIPNDSILPRITHERLDNIINAALFANYNCMRVWGGGYYPEDYFFDLCDKYGLLVWEDYMMACSGIWLTDEMCENFRTEAIYNTKRLRHHASLGLLCGNNEIEVMICGNNWGGNVQDRLDYIRLYENVLADVALRYAPQIFYWPSSPSTGGGFDRPDADDDGDVHFWEVWHGEKPFTEYRKHMFRFCSEFGFQSFPSVKTIKTFCEEADMNPFSPVMENHQKCKSGNKKILTYLADNYLYPSKFDNLVYASQLLQAEAIKYGVEYFRSIRKCCKGSIYWQINDCWPVASWSSVDYYGRYKILHYYARKFHAPHLLALLIDDEEISVNVINETMKEFSGKIRLSICQNDMSVIKCKDYDVCINPLNATQIDCFDYVCETPSGEYIYADLYNENGEFVMRQCEIFVRPKHYNWKKPDIKVNARKCDNKVLLSFTSDIFAKSVYVDFDDADIILSDNCFDITDNAAYEIYAHTQMNPDELISKMNIKTVYDIRM